MNAVSMSSILKSLASLPPDRLRLLLSSLSSAERQLLMHDWSIWGRPEQQWEPTTRFTLVKCGRGWGKTRFAVEQTHRMATEPHLIRACAGRIALIGRTAAAVRDDMLFGPSGLMNTQKPWNPCKHEPSKRRITWKSGVVAQTYSADEPDQLRGPNVGFIWGDEIAHWSDPQGAFDTGIMMTLRIGERPSCIMTTTPLPNKLIIGLAKDPKVKVISGSTRENAANLDPEFYEDLVARLGGTALAKQELDGEIVEQNERACFRLEHIQRLAAVERRDIDHIVIGVDPAGGKRKTSDCTGIVVCGIGYDGRGYVLEDITGKHSPEQWAGLAIHAAVKWQATAIVYEDNYGGDMVGATLRQHSDFSLLSGVGCSIQSVTASDGKAVRAAPISLLYEQGKIHHVGDPRKFAPLEHQMTHFDPTLSRTQQDSPDNMDAMVWALTWLFASDARPISSIPRAGTRDPFAAMMGRR